MNYTLSLGNQSILINYTSGFVHIFGEVINVTYLPPFDVNVPGLLKCKFEAFTTQHIETTKYQLVCEYSYNISVDEVYLPIPLKMMKQFENITISDKEFAQARSQLTFWRLLAILAGTVFFAYLIYTEYWTLRE